MGDWIRQACFLERSSFVRHAHRLQLCQISHGKELTGANNYVLLADLFHEQSSRMD